MLKSITDSSAENYDSTNVFVQQKRFLNLISSVEIKPGFKCLDIGCGTGNNTALLVDMLCKEGKVIGIDPDERRIEVARKTYKRENLNFFVGKSIDFPLCDGGYDLIVSNMVMHWVNYNEKIETYERVFNALKPGGVFLIDEVSKRTKVVLQLLSFASKDVADEINSSITCVSPENNREIFTELGFEIISLEEIRYQRNIESLDTYFTWMDATLYGKVNSREIYDQNKAEMKLEINADGSVTHENYGSKIVVRKPMG